VNSCSRFKGTYAIKPLFCSKFLGFWCLLFLLLTIQASAEIYPTDSGPARKLTEQENWILGQIRQGKEADLKQGVAGPQEKYSLDADFLKQLFNHGFKNLEVGNQGVTIANATLVGDLDLDNVEVTYPVCLKQCIFTGKVSLKRSYFKKDLSFEGSHFLKSANFSGIKTDGYFCCDGARFEDECFWDDARIGLEFQARRAEFCSRDALVDFNSIRAGDSFRFEFAKFYGPVSFIRASTGRQFIGHDSKFLNPEKLANFRAITTGNTIFLVRVEFHGPVEFKLAEIGMDFNATGAKFLNENQLKDFSYMKVAQKVMLAETFLRGDYDFSYGDFHDLEIRGAPKSEKNAVEANGYIHFLNLKGAQVQRHLELADLTIDKLNAGQMTVKGVASIENAQINKFADFRGGSFQGLDFENVQWPEVEQPQAQNDSKKSGKVEKKRYRYEVHLGEIAFSSLSIDKPECDANANPCDSEYKEADFNRIMAFVDACPYYTQGYVQVEHFFKRIGRESWGNQVFMRMNDRDLSEKMAWYDPLRWLEWFFWGKIAGYGRAPFRVFFLALAFIILGACLFDPAFLIENKRPPKGNLYRSLAVRVIISLDRFLPIELGLAKDWELKGNSFIIWLYYYLQQVIGWILIPIALASIYSQLK
jgi:hypothetical protein